MRNGRGEARAAGRALSLVAELRRRRVLRVSDAAAELGVARSTAHRLLSALVAHGFAVQDRRRAYRPGPFLTGAGSETAQPALGWAAQPLLVRCGEALGETVSLMVLEGNAVKFTDCAEGLRPLRVGSRVGMLLPAHVTAGGKVLLADLPRERVVALYPRGAAASTGAHTHTAMALPALLRELGTTRRRGYGLNVDESEQGISAVAVGVRDPDGATGAALAVAMPSARFDRRRVPALVERLNATAERIRAGLAGEHAAGRPRGRSGT
jgi:DNA-binding IclR family transcriptional regulator